jgi:four helix bundle protein
MATYDYKKLDVWNRSMDLVEHVYEITKKLPKEETYALSDQLRRAAVSIPSNIAEGQKRSGSKETIQFSYIALGSAAEVETQLILVSRLYEIDVSTQLDECEIISRMLTALTKSLKTRIV